MKSTFFILFLTFIISVQSEFIQYAEEGEIAIIKINRPKALNALNSQVLDELDRVLDRIDTNIIRSLIITGAGEKSFVAGADIAEMSKLTKEEGEEFSKKGNRVFRRIETFPIPVIAAINGFALGGGCEISMSCDIRICSENAIFGQPEVGLGITPGFGGTQRLARIVGLGMAKQMIFTGQNINADEALRIGLVNAVYPQSELLNEAKKLANTIAKNGQNAVKNSKKAINEGIQMDIDSALEIEERLFGDCFQSDEQVDRMKQFLEKGKKKKDKSKNLRETENQEVKTPEEKNKENKVKKKKKKIIHKKNDSLPTYKTDLSEAKENDLNISGISRLTEDKEVQIEPIKEFKITTKKIYKKEISTKKKFLDVKRINIDSISIVSPEKFLLIMI